MRAVLGAILILVACAPGERNAGSAAGFGSGQRYVGTWEGRSYKDASDTGVPFQTVYAIAVDGSLRGTLMFTAIAGSPVPVRTREVSRHGFVQELGPYHSPTLDRDVIAKAVGQIKADSLTGTLEIRPADGGEVILRETFSGSRVQSGLPFQLIRSAGSRAGEQSLTLAQRKLALRADLERFQTAPPLPSANASGKQPESWVTVPVYYATRRDVTGSPDHEKYYGNRDDILRYGVAMITVPEQRRPGTTDGRGWCRFTPGALKCKRKPSSSVVVSELSLGAPKTWLNNLVSAIDSGARYADALVFVHGYNNGFAEATERAAQIAYDAGFEGVILTFDWASRNSPVQYVADQETAERSVPDFKRFLWRVMDSTRARRIAIIAHSMGTRLVSYAIRDMEAERPGRRLSQVIFAASDIDSAIFVQQLADKLAHAATLVTLYGSSHDRAMRASADLVHGAPRVGSGPPSVILYDGLDYVDASDIDTDLIGHGYFAENKEVIDDIFLILRHGFPARERNLRRIPVGRLVYYRFK